jgi:hypothetical protein
VKKGKISGRELGEASLIFGKQKVIQKQLSSLG